MAYVKQEWADGLAGGTPLSAERLNHMEVGIEDASDTSVAADVESGLDAAQNLQELAEALSARIKALEDAA